MARKETGTIDMEHFDLWQAITKMDGKFDVMSTKLDQILIQTIKTNSRVTHLEESSEVMKDNYLRESLADKVEYLEGKIEDITNSIAWVKFFGKNSKYIWMLLIILLGSGSGMTILKALKLM